MHHAVALQTRVLRSCCSHLPALHTLLRLPPGTALSCAGQHTQADQEGENSEKLDSLVAKFQDMIFQRRNQRKTYNSAKRVQRASYLNNSHGKCSRLISNGHQKVNRTITTPRDDSKPEQLESNFSHATQTRKTDLLGDNISCINSHIAESNSKRNLVLVGTSDAIDAARCKDECKFCSEMCALKQSSDTLRRLGHKERSLLLLILNSKEKPAEFESLDNCVRQNLAPSFDVLLRVCAWASKGDQAHLIHQVQEVTCSLHPAEYRQHLNFNYYLASALCYGGDVEGSLAMLLQLYRQHPHGHKKVKDTTRFVLQAMLESESEKNLPLALEFVKTVETELGNQGPALALWSVTFCSPLYRLQEVSGSLLEQHRGLVRKVERRLTGMVEHAAWEGDQPLLYRILHLALHYQLTAHYPIITSALLRLQCDLGDMSAAEETIKFAQVMGVRVRPVVLQRFLTLLSHHHRPAPLALLALKYSPQGTKRASQPPPSYKYKF